MPPTTSGGRTSRTSADASTPTEASWSRTPATASWRPSPAPETRSPRRRTSSRRSTIGAAPIPGTCAGAGRHRDRRGQPRGRRLVRCPRDPGRAPVRRRRVEWDPRRRRSCRLLMDGRGRAPIRRAGRGPASRASTRPSMSPSSCGTGGRPRISRRRRWRRGRPTGPRSSVAHDELGQLMDSWKEAEAGTLARSCSSAASRAWARPACSASWPSHVHRRGGPRAVGSVRRRRGGPLPALGRDPPPGARAPTRSRALLADHPPLQRAAPRARRRAGSTLAATAAPPGTGVELERLQLFDAMSDAIADLARDAPLLIVLDDLHWAAPPSLLLLRHVVRERTDVRRAARRLVPRQRGRSAHPLADLLVDLGRDVAPSPLAVTGLDEAARPRAWSGRRWMPIDPEGDRSERLGRWRARGPPARPAGTRSSSGRCLSHLGRARRDRDPGGRRAGRPGRARRARRRPRGDRPSPGPAVRRGEPGARRWPRSSAPQFDLDTLEAVPDAVSDGERSARRPRRVAASPG